MSAAYKLDQQLAAIERARLNPPDDATDHDEAPQFSDLSHDDQRSTIRDWFRKDPSGDGLFSEAINEHALANAIRAAFYANDTELFGKLCDRAVREYIGNLIQKDWDRAHG